jgi:hypothetical protein
METEGERIYGKRKMKEDSHTFFLTVSTKDVAQERDEPQEPQPPLLSPEDSTDFDAGSAEGVSDKEVAGSAVCMEEEDAPASPKASSVTTNDSKDDASDDDSCDANAEFAAFRSQITFLTFLWALRVHRWR